MSGARLKSYILYDAICIVLWRKQNYSPEREIRSGLPDDRLFLEKVVLRKFWRMMELYILTVYFDGYMSIYTCQNSQNVQ